MNHQPQTTGEPRLTRQQQIALIAGNPIADVLNDKQKRHLQWRRKVRGELSPDIDEPSFHLFAVHEDGQLTYQFQVQTLSPKWYVHVYVHSTWEHFKKHHKTRSEQVVLGCVICKVSNIQTGGLLAEIHLLAVGLSELTIVHESVHTAAYLARILSTPEAKELAAPYVGDKGNMLKCREEIQCRTVELLTKQTVMYLQMLGLSCVAIRNAEI